MSILTVSGVNKTFGGLHALNDVNLIVEKGTVHAIIGPNGAGKSTLLNCMVGRLDPDSGTVIFDEKSLLRMHPHEINQVGVVRVCSFQMNLWRPIRKRAEIRDRAVKVLTDVGLDASMDTIAETLSRGDKRRLELAMGLVQEPKLLLLDEPTAGMSRADTNKTIDLLKTISETGITMIVIEHDMHVVFSLADRISVLAQGTVIAEDVPSAIKGNPKVQEAYLGGH